MLYSFCYNLVLVLAGILWLPKMLFSMMRQGKYRQSLRQRFSFSLPRLAAKNGLVIWIHAVSFGETRAVIPLVRRLKQEWPDCSIIFSNITESGAREAKAQLKEIDAHLFLPFDLSFLVRRAIKRLSPDLVLLTETDFWYHFLQESHKKGAKIALINGKISSASAANWRFFKGFAKRLFAPIDLFLLQGRLYRERFLELNIPADKIQVSGNLKLDNAFKPMSPIEAADFKARLNLSDQDFVVTIGSTHAPEEEELLSALFPLFARHSNLKVLLVPRHPERFIKVSALLQRLKYPFNRLSQPEKKEAKIILVDALGLLRQCYQVSDVAIVAGSFNEKIGGHNVIEPCYYGVPVLFGPHMSRQPDLLRLVQEYGCGEEVSLASLESALERLMQDAQLRKEMGEKGLSLVNEACGATEKTLIALKQLIR